jgi:molecular chaperone IbpA
MTRITAFDLTPLYRNSIGVDRLFNRIVNQIDSASSTGNYPPYDIVKTGEDRYEIRIAAAGFKDGEIEVELQDSELIVRGCQENTVTPELDYLHHGISNRAWVRNFPLSEYIEVKSAAMQDGILTINLVRVVPEALKPKKIEIAYNS